MQTLIYNPIPYKEAADLLEIEDTGTIRAAARRGILTKVPSTSQVQLVIKEQVELFKGKNQIRKSLLTDHEKTLWYQYDNAVKNYYENNADHTDTSKTNSSDNTNLGTKLATLLAIGLILLLFYPKLIEDNKGTEYTKDMQEKAEKELEDAGISKEDITDISGSVDFFKNNYTQSLNLYKILNDTGILEGIEKNMNKTDKRAS